MSTKSNVQKELSEKKMCDRRGFLAVAGRNALAIGVTGASVALARVDKAFAQACPPNSNNPSCNCFLKGTRILTVDGEQKVEDLAIGDLLPTAFGGARPIQWIGHHRYRRSDSSKPWVQKVRPVRIGRGAIAPNLPHEDLYLTGGHALFLDGVLIQARQLVNGKTITFDPADELDELVYYHIKLETHDVIYAAGVACESLLTVNETFNNFADYLRRYGAPESSTETCAPVLSNGARAEITARLRVLTAPWRGPYRLDVIRDHLDARASALGCESAQFS